MRQERQEALQSQLEVLRILGESGRDSLFLWEIATGRLHLFGGISQHYPIPVDERGRCTIEDWRQAVYEKDRDCLWEGMDQTARGKIRECTVDFRLVNREGNRVWTHCQGECLRDKDGVPRYVVGRISDTVLEGKVDLLTGAFNSIKLAEDMNRILQADYPCCLLLLGMDNFKKVNLYRGREHGNQVLRTMAGVLEELVRPGVRIYRSHGDCFAVNLPEYPREEVESLYQKLQVRMEPYGTISAGLVSYRENRDADSHTLYQYAEETLDRAKQMGKNRLAVFSLQRFQEKLSTVALLGELYQSIQRDFCGFSVCYQPQVRRGGYDLFGAEALLRYQSPTRGEVSPEEFVPVLEQMGMIGPVGLWVLKTALAQCRSWRKALPQVHISVNISNAQLTQPDIAEQVLELLAESGLPGRALTLEITESIQMQDYESFNRLFCRWRQAGIEISIDDFGTGYSALAHLKNLEIDEVKMDRCFVSGVQYSAYNYRLLKNMIELAHSSHIRVCCEGVESREELAALEKLEADLLQGFLFYTPLTGEAFARSCLQPEAPEYQARMQHIARLRGEREGKGPLDVSWELNCQEVLRSNQLGLWLIKMDPENDRREMYADQTMREVLGLEEELSPQACYQHWYSRIHDGYYQYVNLAVESMIRSGRVVQLEYPWQHPARGEVMVCCSGSRGKDRDGMICLEGYHRILSDLERPQFLPDTPTGEVFEFNERQGTIYFHTQRTLLAGQARQEQRFPQCWLEQEMVHPHFAKRFAGLFQNVRHGGDLDGEEILLRSPQGTYDWFRMRIRHLGAEEQDQDTVLVLLDGADELRLLQLENMRIREFYRASLGEAIAYAEVDLESGQVKETGGLWADYPKELGCSREAVLQFMRHQVEQYARPDQRAALLWKMTAWAELLSHEQEIQRFRYQRRIDDQWHWVELVAHSFQEQFTENIYALLYLKDIDAQVRRERAQQEAANRDPLTGIYNRNAFQQEVLEYMEDSTGKTKGVLIVLDVDNFKQINDRQGHQEGDAALRYVVQGLQHSFRHGDVLGRMGGDEFLIFLKGEISRTTLNMRMDRFYETLRSYPNFPITCSAGIVFVQSREFSYQQSVFQADMALYQSKKNGRAHYTYAEDGTEGT